MKECIHCEKLVCFIGFYPNHVKMYIHEDEKSYLCKARLLEGDIRERKVESEDDK